MPRGGAREGAGQKKGNKNRRQQAKTQVLDRELASGQEMPLEYLLRVMRDESQPDDRRDKAANAAAPYCHARKVDANLTGNFEVVVKSQTVRLAD